MAISRQFLGPQSSRHADNAPRQTGGAIAIRSTSFVQRKRCIFARCTLPIGLINKGIDMIRLWRRWRQRVERLSDERVPAVKYGDPDLRNELRHLLQQREIIEQRGCFSDRELEIKEREIEEIDLRVKTLKNQQMRLRTHGKIRA